MHIWHIHPLVGHLISWSVTVSDFHSAGVFGPSRSVGRPSWNVIYFLKAMTNSFLISMLCVINLGGGGFSWVTHTHTHYLGFGIWDIAALCSL